MASHPVSKKCPVLGKSGQAGDSEGIALPAGGEPASPMAAEDKQSERATVPQNDGVANAELTETNGVTKRKRSLSLSPEPTLSQDAILLTAPTKQLRASKKARTQKTGLGTIEEDASDDEEKETKAIDKKAQAAEKKAKAAAAKSGKANERKLKHGWKSWINAPENKTRAQFQRTSGDNLINVKESDKVYSIKRDELNCLPHCSVPNPHGQGFTPMKLFKVAEVQRLAYRKEAMFAGVLHDDDDDEELLAQGKEMHEEKHG